MQTTTLRQQAYQHLRQRLLSGELQAGTQLSEPDLARQLGMSRTPVREALRQMENEGLLEYAPRFGATVRTPDRDELDEMYAVREALESYAAAEAARKVGQADLAKLDAALQQMQDVAKCFCEGQEAVLEGDGLHEFLRADMDFHRIVIAAAGNRYLSKILEDTRLVVRVFMTTSWQYDAAKLQEAVAFHRRLYEALRTGDEAAARDAASDAMIVARANALHAWDKRQS